MKTGSQLVWRLEPLVIRCGRGSQHPAESGPPGLRLSNPGERERHNADGHKSGGSIYCSSVRSPTPSHTHTTLSNKVRGTYFFKRSLRSSLLLCRYDSICMKLHMTIQHHPIHLYHTSLPVGLPDYILCLHRPVVGKFLLVVNTGTSMWKGP